LEDMRTTFDSVYGSAGEPWLWKDPRLCLTLPLWRRVLDHPYVLLVLREPSAVARSLHARDGLRRSYAFALWERYLRSALTAADGLPTVIVRYEDVLADPTAAVAEVRSKLDEIGLTLPGDPATAATHISSPRPSAASAGHAGSRPQQELLDAIAQMPRAASAFRPPAIRPERWLSRRWRFNRIDARRSGILQLTRP